MEQLNSNLETGQAAVSLRKRWEEPAILLERSLEVSAEGVPPNRLGAPRGFLGPLGTSGNKGTCL
jgi:hypothetical protein